MESCTKLQSSLIWFPVVGCPSYSENVMGASMCHWQKSQFAWHWCLPRLILFGLVIFFSSLASFQRFQSLPLSGLILERTTATLESTPYMATGTGDPSPSISYDDSHGLIGSPQAQRITKGLCHQSLLLWDWKIMHHSFIIRWPLVLTHTNSQYFSLQLTSAITITLFCWRGLKWLEHVWNCHPLLLNKFIHNNTISLVSLQKSRLCAPISNSLISHFFKCILG